MQLPLTSQPIGNPFTELQSIDSTNNYALQQIHAGMAQHGMCLFAHEQTAGRGQRGKTWDTEKGANVIMSIVLRPSFLQTFQQFQLSACIAVATHQFLARYAGDSTKIKWPNDLYWQDRKLGGILIENVVRANGLSNWEWAVVGIGVNINQSRFPRLVGNAVSLKMITGLEWDVIQMAKEICQHIDESWNRLSHGEFAEILRLYNEHLYKRGQVTRLKQGSRVFDTTIQGVNDNGELVTFHAIEERFGFGEVIWT